MKLEVLIRDIQPLGVAGPRDREISGVVCDSRHVRPGYLFVAVPGAKQNGSVFVEDAVERGATAIVSETDSRLRKDVSFLRVTDARQALARLACLIHGEPTNQLQMLGVTGTNGKTTTAYMIKNILTAEGRNPGLIGTVEYLIGARAIPASRTTPDAPTLQDMFAQMVAAGCRSAVMEVSSHALLQRRTAGIDFDVGIFTNLTRDHLDYHQTMENYFEAKTLLFRGLGMGKKRATAVLNIDDPWGQRLSQLPGLKADVLTYGLNPKAVVYAENLELGPNGSMFRVKSPWGEIQVTTRLMGRFNVHNALASFAACGALGANVETMGAVLASMTSVPGRLEEIKTGKGFQIFVDYAHTDDALGHVLKTLREIARGRLIVVFGCGGNRDRTKRPVMGKVAAELADYSILTSDNPRNEDPRRIIAEIQEGFKGHSNFEVLEDRTEAIQKAIARAGKGDVVLIAGKGHENFQEFANRSIPFDDRQVVRRFL
jgi:UDP-N-acetylmuramoyl-L-alanyl-D-glutamate--2,6-diaminopimelate ligase